MLANSPRQSGSPSGGLPSTLMLLRGGWRSELPITPRDPEAMRPRPEPGRAGWPEGLAITSYRIPRSISI